MAAYRQDMGCMQGTHPNTQTSFLGVAMRQWERICSHPAGPALTHDTRYDLEAS